MGCEPVSRGKGHISQRSKVGPHRFVREHKVSVCWRSELLPSHCGRLDHEQGLVACWLRTPRPTFHPHGV